MRDYIEIGPAPYDEECAQVGDPDYTKRSRVETRVYMNAIERMFGTPPKNADLAVKRFKHDFGEYKEVIVRFEDTDQDSVEYAFNIENNAPRTWEKCRLTEVEVADLFMVGVKVYKSVTG